MNEPELSSGSSEDQIKRFTTRIAQITEHLKKNKKDHSSRRGLMHIINKRRKLLNYLHRRDEGAYKKLIEETGIRHTSR